MNMLPILAIEVGAVVTGKILAYGIFKWINDQEMPMEVIEQFIEETLKSILENIQSVVC